jgi:hypothetical protein
MKKQTKETSLIKPIVLLLLQGIALYIIFYLLSTKEYFSDFERGVLTFSLAFIMIFSLVTFGILGRLREEENQKQQKKATF